VDWRVVTLIWISRLTGLGLVIYFLKPSHAAISSVFLKVKEPTVMFRGTAQTPWDVLDWCLFLFGQLPPVLLFLFGLYCLLGGRWLLRRMLRGLDGTCPACGHPLPDNSARCTECGLRFLNSQVTAGRLRARQDQPDAKESADE